MGTQKNRLDETKTHVFKKLMGKEIFQMYAEFILPIWNYGIGTLKNTQLITVLDVVYVHCKKCIVRQKRWQLILARPDDSTW